jgi:hypothetical protein
MKRFLYLLLTAPGLVFCQDTVSKNIGDFTELKVYDQINLELVQSDTNKIEIYGYDADQVQVINKNGKLKIRMTLPKTFDGGGIKATLYYKSVLVVDVNEGAFVYSAEPIKVTSFECRAQEGARIELNVMATYLETKAYSGAMINLNGTAQKQVVKVNTGGIVKAQKMETTDSDVYIRAGGEVEVFVTGLLNANIKAGGAIYVYGSPRTVSKSNLIGGRVVLVN